jgi:uncharacterized SAM-binding protein YcdF (DUF218 family)
MTRFKRATIGLAGLTLWLFVLGFVIFATFVMRTPDLASQRADGIVVLTGGQTRIAEGARLLDEGRGERLLISGVNEKTTREQLFKLSGLDKAKFDCCVDLGYAALDTIGNADETHRWADGLHYDSLIIVTASYHMPRSMAELKRAMPTTKLYAHPVLPKDLTRRAWWLDATASRILVSEYLKFLPAAARLAATRAIGPWHSGSLAQADASSAVK